MRTYQIKIITDEPGLEDGPFDLMDRETHPDVVLELDFRGKECGIIHIYNKVQDAITKMFFPHKTKKK